jgi:hypothetical protein
MNFNDLKTTVLKITYMKPTTTNILANELTNCIIFLLGNKALAPRLPKDSTLANNLHKLIVNELRPRMTVLAKAAYEPKKLSYLFYDDIKTFGDLVKAPDLKEDRKEVSVIELEVPKLEDTRYKTEEALVSGEVGKFITACQVLSSTCGSTVITGLQFPLLKSHAKIIPHIRYNRSASDPTLIYVFVPEYARDVCIEYCPESISKKSLAEVNSDLYNPPALPDLW